jgi:hypothetical protein
MALQKQQAGPRNHQGDDESAQPEDLTQGMRQAVAPDPVRDGGQPKQRDRAQSDEQKAHDFPLHWDPGQVLPPRRRFVRPFVRHTPTDFQSCKIVGLRLLRVALHLCQHPRHLFDGNALLSIQIRFAHRQSGCYIAGTMTFDEF